MDVLDIVLVNALIVIGYVLVMAAQMFVGYLRYDWNAEKEL